MHTRNLMGSTFCFPVLQLWCVLQQTCENFDMDGRKSQTGLWKPETQRTPEPTLEGRWRLGFPELSLTVLDGVGVLASQFLACHTVVKSFPWTPCRGLLFHNLQSPVRSNSAISSGPQRPEHRPIPLFHY